MLCLFLYAVVYNISSAQIEYDVTYIDPIALSVQGAVCIDVLGAHVMFVSNRHRRFSPQCQHPNTNPPPEKPLERAKPVRDKMSNRLSSTIRQARHRHLHRHKHPNTRPHPILVWSEVTTLRMYHTTMMTTTMTRRVAG